jgi:uncharacterized protein YecT (DUF1311 family)
LQSTCRGGSIAKQIIDVIDSIAVIARYPLQLTGDFITMKLPVLIAALLFLRTASAFAVDNPDAPDYVADFLARATPYEEEVDKDSGGAKAAADYAAYEKFLDQELNKAYVDLTNKLSDAKKQELIKSQKNWLAYRDSEFQFIEHNWTEETSGSSYTASAGDYRAEIVKSRAIILLNYLKNYP